MAADQVLGSDVESASGLLAALAGDRAAENDAAARLLEHAAEWAIMHPAESVLDAATFHEGRYGDTEIPVAGPGAPLVAEFSITEFAAAVGMSTEAGKRLLGQAVEIRYRLPRLWQRVITGDLWAWRARRVAEATLGLSLEAAAFVDRHVASVAHKVGPAQLERLVDEAIARYLPEEVEQQRRRAADGRRFDIDDHQVSFKGTMEVHGELDIADALDLQAAVTRGAADLKALARPSRWTCDAPRPPASSPATSSPSTSPPTTTLAAQPAAPAVVGVSRPDQRQMGSQVSRQAQSAFLNPRLPGRGPNPARLCSTSTSPRPLCVAPAPAGPAPAPAAVRPGPGPGCRSPGSRAIR